MYFGARYNNENTVILDYERDERERERQEERAEWWDSDDIDRCMKCGKRFYGDNDYCEWCEEEEA
jgi:hypothetical protein